MRTLKLLKQLLAKEKDNKNMGKIKTIIRWQITRDSTIGTMKIDQSAFIKDLVIEKGFNDYNVSIILIKARSSIEMLDLDDYKETDFYKY